MTKIIIIIDSQVPLLVGNKWFEVGLKLQPVVGCFGHKKNIGFVRWEARSSQLLVAFPKNHPGGLPVTPFEKRGKNGKWGRKSVEFFFFEDPRIIIKWSVCKRPARNEWLHEGVGATCKVLTNNKTAGVKVVC